MAFRRNFLFRLLAEVLGKVLAMVVTVALARRLGAEAWGGLQWALAGAGLFGVLADFGLGSLATRELALAKEKDRHAWVLAAWQLKGALWAVALLLFVGFQAWAGPSKAGLLLPAALLTVALSLGELSSSLYTGFERLDLDFRWGFSSKLAQAVAALTALFLGWGAQGVLLSMAVAAWAGWALSLLGLWRMAPAGKLFPVAPKRRVLLIGLWPFGLVSVFTLIYFKVDNLLLEHFAGLAAVGIYQSAYKWWEALAFVPAAFIAAAFPGLARSHRETDGHAKRLKAYLAMGGLGAAATAFLFAWAPLLPRVMGPAYAEAPPLLRALAWGCLAWFPNFVLLNLLVAGRQQSRVLLGASLAVLFNVGGNLYLLPRYGALGAAWMTAGTEGVIFLSAAWSLRGHLSWLKAAGGLGLAAAAAALGCVTALAVAQQASLPSLLAAAIVGPGLTLAMTAWWGLLPMQDLRALADRIVNGRKV
jgi:O-antigen/teichoic acid export membrane protein